MGKDFQQKPHLKAVTISAEELPEVLGQILAPTKHSPPHSSGYTAGSCCNLLEL